MSTVKIGDKIPEFKTVDQNEKDVSRQDFLGSKSVFIFLPQRRHPYMHESSL